MTPSAAADHPRRHQCRAGERHEPAGARRRLSGRHLERILGLHRRHQRRRRDSHRRAGADRPLRGLGARQRRDAALESAAAGSGARHLRARGRRRPPARRMAVVPTGSTAPTFTITAPNGSFYVRMKSSRGRRAQPAVERGAAAHQRRAQAECARPTSRAPSRARRCGWRGATPSPAARRTSLMLDVTGAVTATLPLPLSESFSVPGHTKRHLHLPPARRERRRRQQPVELGDA